MALSKIRYLLNRVSRMSGDAAAIRNGTIHKRLARRVLTRAASRVIRRMIK